MRVVIFLLPDNDASERAEPPVRGGIIRGMCGRGCTGSSEPSCPVLGPTAKPRTPLGRLGALAHGYSRPKGVNKTALELDNEVVEHMFREIHGDPYTEFLRNIWLPEEEE